MVVIAAAGYSRGDFAGDGAGGDDLIVAMITPAGSITWSDQYGNDGNDIAQAVAFNPDGTVVAAGRGAPDFGNVGLVRHFVDDDDDDDLVYRYTAREQMAAFLARFWRAVMLDSCSGNSHPFSDVAATSFARDDVGCIFSLGITTGTSDTTYGPSDFVTREQMAAFLARLFRAATS